MAEIRVLKKGGSGTNIRALTPVFLRSLRHYESSTAVVWAKTPKLRGEIASARLGEQWEEEQA